MNLSLHTIANWLNAQAPLKEAICQSITIDSRKIEPGSLFIAIKGEQFDGHDYIEEARKKGALAAIVSQSVETDLPIILVQDTRKALGLLAKKWREKWSIPVIAVTGSCGKTTTKAMIAEILSQQGQVLATQGTMNNDIGLPLTAFQLNSTHEYAVFELGANHMGEIEYLADIIKPDVAVITNVAPAHLEGFGSIENIARAKGEIYQKLAENGVAILNMDDQFVDFWKSSLSHKKQIGFSQKNSADFIAQNIRLDTQGHLQFLLQGPDEKQVDIQLPLMGTHHVGNALAAAAACHAVGIPFESIQKGLIALSPIGKRLVPYETKQGAKILDDSYNANPLSLFTALKVLVHFPQEKILILGDMNELGEQAEESHREAGHQAKALGVHALYAVGKLSRFAAEAFGEHGYHFENKQDLIERIKPLLGPESVILVKGSRGAKMEEVVEALKS